MKIITIAALALIATGAFADEYVNGYTRSNGTYVQPHYRSSPNNTTADNWSTKGNVNPYTGQEGTKNPTDYNSSNNNNYYQNNSNSETANHTKKSYGF